MIDINDTRIPAAIRERAKNAKPKEHIDNTQALASSGLKIVHCNGGNNFTRKPKRSLTIAYEQINKSHVRISTAVCHKADAFEKKIGTKIALANFAKGNTVILPISAEKDYPLAQQLRDMFGFVAA